jgi:hypothetical protein
MRCQHRRQHSELEAKFHKPGCRGGLRDFRCVLNHDHPGNTEHEPCIRDCAETGTCELHEVPNRGCKRCYIYAVNDTGGEQ